MVLVIFAIVGRNQSGVSVKFWDPQNYPMKNKGDGNFLLFDVCMLFDYLNCTYRYMPFVYLNIHLPDRCMGECWWQGSKASTKLLWMIEVGVVVLRCCSPENFSSNLSYRVGSPAIGFTIPCGIFGTLLILLVKAGQTKLGEPLGKQSISSQLLLLKPLGSAQLG